MQYKPGLAVISFVAVIALIGALAWLTASDEDSCANPQADISASVLAETEHDQDAMVNRAIITRANCEEK